MKTALVSVQIVLCVIFAVSDVSSLGNNGQSGFSEDVLAVFTNRFNDFDQDGDGKLTVTELVVAVSPLNHLLPKDKLMDIILETAGRDRDGKIDINGFLQVARQVAQCLTQESARMREAFSSFDKDGDGYISMSDLRQTATDLGQNLSDGDAELMMREADVDGDGKISLEEFVMVRMGKSLTRVMGTEPAS